MVSLIGAQSAVQGWLAPLEQESACAKDPTGAVPGLCRCEQGHVTLTKAEIVADQIEQTIVGQRWESLATCSAARWS
jgi:hypothetical protein